jgi:hypothetical protein
LFFQSGSARWHARHSRLALGSGLGGGGEKLTVRQRLTDRQFDIGMPLTANVAAASTDWLPMASGRALGYE